MTTATARRLACSIALLGALGPAGSLQAQLGVGTWVRKATPSMPAMTMTVEACCNGGRRLTYHIDINGTETILAVASPFDGSEAEVLIAGKPAGRPIEGEDFYRALLRIWLGDKPVQDDLKKSLLGG